MAGRANIKETPVNWFDKPLSIKTDTELSAQIQQYLAAFDGSTDTPTNAKQLIISLLSGRVNQTQIEDLTRELSESKEELKRLQEVSLEETERINEEKARLLKENEGLKQENESLLKENEQLSNPKTLTASLLQGLQTRLPAFVKEGDESIITPLERIAFTLNEYSEGETALKNIISQLETKVKEAENRPVKLKSGQAILNFTPEQLINISKARKIQESMGMQFEGGSPSEVIHAVIADYLEVLKLLLTLQKQAVNQLKEFAAIEPHL